MSSGASAGAFDVDDTVGMSAASPRAYGDGYKRTAADKFGIYLSTRAVRRWVPSFAGLRIGDFGCGYNAELSRTLLPAVQRAHLVDVSLAADLCEHPKVVATEGQLPDALADLRDHSLDVILCLSVLEHLWKPKETLSELRRLLAPGGVCLVNVPSWRGKWFLELSAFRLGMTVAEQIDDHKRYYDPKDLWPSLVEAGWRPQNIRCFRHKFGLNTFAVCRVD
jgi:SAM-dependent methyltransferase